jgi:hypothetical protein
MRDSIAGQWRKRTSDKKGSGIQGPARSDEVIAVSTYTFVHII